MKLKAWPHDTHNIKIHFIKSATKAGPLPRDRQIGGHTVSAAVACQTFPTLQDGSHDRCRLLLQSAPQADVLLHFSLIHCCSGVAPQRPREEAFGKTLRSRATLSRHQAGRQRLWAGQRHEDTGFKHVPREQLVQRRAGRVGAEVTHGNLEPEGS